MFFMIRYIFYAGQFTIVRRGVSMLSCNYAFLMPQANYILTRAFEPKMRLLGD